MKVALVHDFLYVFGGAERVLLQLHRMYPAAPVFTLVALPEVVAELEGADVRTSYLQRGFRRGRQAGLLTKAARAVESFDLRSYDLVISSSGAFSHGVITDADATHVCYCHSPMRYVWDASADRTAPFGWAGEWALSTALHRIRTWDAISAKRVDVWIANSAAVAARIRRYYGAASTVAYPPVDVPFYLPAAGQPYGDYAVTVGRLTAAKKFTSVIRAAAANRLPLKIIGDGAERPALKALANSLGADVSFEGRVSDERKRELLHGARCFLFAAEEDFGIVLAEAQAAGLPVVAPGRGGAGEIVRDGVTGVLCDAEDGLPAALGRFLAEGVTADRQAIAGSAARFGPEAFTAAIREAASA